MALVSALEVVQECQGQCSAQVGSKHPACPLREAGKVPAGGFT